MPSQDERPTSVALLQQLVGNACVNDGAVVPAEARSADALIEVLTAPGIRVERFEPEPGRTSIVARLVGRDPSAPRLLLHTPLDVAPADASRWTRDPFAGEVDDDGWLWGRGALEPLSFAATMTTAMRELADEGFRPSGDLVLAAVADHQGFGRLGLRWLLEHRPQLLDAAWVVAWGSNAAVATPTGTSGACLVAEKGLHTFGLRVAGEATRTAVAPGRSAMDRAAAAIAGLHAARHPGSSSPVIGEFLGATGWGDAAPLLARPSPERDHFIDALPAQLSAFIDDLIRPGFTVTGASGHGHGGLAPATVDLDVLASTIEDQDGSVATALLQAALGPDLREHTRITPRVSIPSRTTPTGTTLWEALERTESTLNGRALAPLPSGRWTGSNLFRARGAVVYGYAAYSDRLTAANHLTMDRGDDERIDLESLTLMQEGWKVLARDLLTGA
jgi:acetylornithine deacetylase/succinyl-diaminopimelate desuccinylase-like protein